MIGTEGKVGRASPGNPKEISKELLGAWRSGARLSAVGLVLALALGWSLKWANLMPPHMTWLGIIIGPAAAFGAFGSAFVCALWLRSRWMMAFLPMAVLCIAAVLAVLYVERG
jgi:hypothetical protein